MLEVRDWVERDKLTYGKMHGAWYASCIERCKDGSVTAITIQSTTLKELRALGWDKFQDDIKGWIRVDK